MPALRVVATCAIGDADRQLLSPSLDVPVYTDKVTTAAYVANLTVNMPDGF